VGLCGFSLSQEHKAKAVATLPRAPSVDVDRAGLDTLLTPLRAFG
jgi:hypothetical protein